MFHEKYFFEGETVITCSKCGVVHTVSFSGMNPCSVEQAIEEAMECDGWGVASMTCADCYDPMEEQRQRDAEIEETDIFDDFEEDYMDYEDDERGEV